MNVHNDQFVNGAGVAYLPWAAVPGWPRTDVSWLPSQAAADASLVNATPPV